MKIEIPAPLRVYTGNQATVVMPGSTVAEVVSGLTTAYPEFHRHLYTPDGRLQSFVELYLNNEDVRYLPDREETEVRDTDTLSILPSSGGGKAS